MNKRQLLKTLEPFEDEIEIGMVDDNGYMFSPRVFYSTQNEYARILLVGSTEPLGNKSIELKIRG